MLEMQLLLRQFYKVTEEISQRNRSNSLQLAPPPGTNLDACLIITCKYKFSKQGMVSDFEQLYKTFRKLLQLSPKS